jgi:hypothetical protein
MAAEILDYITLLLFMQTQMISNCHKRGAAPPGRPAGISRRNAGKTATAPMLMP